jgi:hypothetical protein
MDALEVFCKYVLVVMMGSNGNFIKPMQSLDLVQGEAGAPPHSNVLVQMWCGEEKQVNTA